MKQPARIPASGGRSCAVAALLAGLLTLGLLSGPAAVFLQAHGRAAAPDGSWDAVYLVCGARAQHRRITAMTRWLDAQAVMPSLILVGNDPHRSFWSRAHQRNLTRTEWGIAAIEAWRHTRLQAGRPVPEVRGVPGVFSNTDGEMRALAAALGATPDIRRIALVTCRFHVRRALWRFAARVPGGITAAAVPGTVHWEDHTPWIVATEYLKMLRDAAGFSQNPLLSRPLP